jgi:hypothetical protein
MSLGQFWAETWRLGLTIIALLGLVGIWALIIPNLTPFGGSYTPAQVEAEKERAHRYQRLHRITVRLDVLFFIWLVVEGAALIPWLFIRYGLR